MDRKIFFTLFVSVLLGAMLLVLYQVFAPFLSSLLWAGILVILTFPLYKKVLSKMPERPELASLIMCSGLTLLLLLPATLLSLVLIKDLIEGAQSLTETLQNTDYRSVMSFDHAIFQHPTAQKLIQLLEQEVDLQQIDFRAGILNGMKEISSFMVERSKSFLAAFSSFFFVLIMVEINMFFLFRDGPDFIRFVKRQIPIAEATKDIVLGRIREVVMASIFGSVGTAVAQGLVGGLGFFILGVPSAVLWTVVMMIMGFLPMGGPFLVWAPAAVYLFFQGAWIKALILTLWGALVVGTVDNLLRPFLIKKISSKENQLNTLVLFLSVLGGIRIFGFLGIVLAPLMIVMLLTLLEMLSAALGYSEGNRIVILPEEQNEAPLPTTSAEA